MMGISTAIDNSAVARVLGIKTEFKDFRGGGVLFLPRHIAVIGQGNTSSTYSTTKAQYTSALAVANAYGFGSPLHLASKQYFPDNGDGVGTIPVTFFPLVDAGSSAASTSTITPSGTQTVAAAYRVVINEMVSPEFVINANDDVATRCTAIAAAINAEINLPVTAVATATEVTLTSKWKGTSANDIYVEVSGSTTAGTTFAIVQPSGGLINPDVTTATAQMGDVWYTEGLNCLEISDTTNLDRLNTFTLGRWGALVRKPLAFFVGNTSVTVADATIESEARKTTYGNISIPSPGSKNLPLVIAAKAMARIAKLSNNNPPHDYGSQVLNGVTPGLDSQQWDNPARDEAVKKGSSTTIVKDGVVYMGDVVTFHHPTGDPLPAYRFWVDIVKLQNIIFNVDLIFNTAEWDGAPLIPDDQPTVNPLAKQPKAAKAAAAAMVESLGLNAIISDPETAKANINAQINDQNPKRLDMTIPVQVSGNTNIKSIDLQWSFYFGTSALIA